MGYAFIGEGADISAPGPSGKIGLINQNTVGSLQGQVPEQTGPFHPPVPEQAGLVHSPVPEQTGPVHSPPRIRTWQASFPLMSSPISLFVCS